MSNDVGASRPTGIEYLVPFGSGPSNPPSANRASGGSDGDPLVEYSRSRYAGIESVPSLGALLAPTALADTSDAPKVLEAVEGAFQSTEGLAGLPTPLLLLIGGIVAFTAVAHILAKSEHVKVYSKSARFAVSQGIRGLAQLGPWKTKRWLDAESIASILEGEDVSLSPDERAEILMSGAAGVLSFDHAGRTPLGIMALSSFLGIYWEDAGKKSFAREMRKAETKIQERGRPEFLGEMKLAAVHHDRVAKRITGAGMTPSEFTDSHFIKALHLYSSAQLLFQSAIHGEVRSVIAKDLQIAGERTDEAIEYVVRSGMSKWAFPVDREDMTDMVGLRMARLLGEIERAKVDLDEGNVPPDAFHSDDFDSRLYDVDDGATFLHFSAAPALAPFLIPTAMPIPVA